MRLHLDNKYRLAFTMRPAHDDQYEGIVEVLYAGRREQRRSQDVWTIVHDLFGEKNPPADHWRRPCCEAGLPSIDDDELEQYLTRLRRFLRGR